MLAVLAFHKVGDPPRGAWQPWFYVPPGRLAEHLSALRESGWYFVDLMTALRGLLGEEPLPEKSALVTFDDSYRSVHEHGLQILVQIGAPCTVFVAVEFVGGVAGFDAGVAEPLEPLCSWSELAELASAGVSIQSHGCRHVRLSGLTTAALDDELSRSKQVLEERLGAEVVAIAYPYGDAGDSERVVPALERCGYRAGFLYDGGAVRPPVADRYRIARIAVGVDTDLSVVLGQD